MPSYPRVVGELETLREVAAGASLARYGDGEFKLCRGGSIKSQEHLPALGVALREILHDSGECLVGIPNLHSKTPKRQFWDQYQWAASLLTPGRRYRSAFVSRPDSAPWLDTPEYWALLESLWVGRDVTLVRGSGKGLTCEDLTGAGTITEILCPRQHAFIEMDAILERIGRPARALLCLGPTATVLAVELCRRGVHAIDLGHTALFLRKQRRGVPLNLTPEDKAAV